MKRSSFLVIIFFAVLSLVLGAVVTHARGPVLTGGEPAPTVVSLTGTWDVSVDSPSGKETSVLVLQQNIFGKITGTCKAALGEPKVQGKIFGSNFEFSFNSKGIDITYAGKIEGNKISGSVDFGSSGKGTFTGEKK